MYLLWGGMRSLLVVLLLAAAQAGDPRAACSL